MDLKYKIFYFILVQSLVWANSNDNKRGFIVDIGDPAPDFSMLLTTGETLKLSELKGSTVILQFTASWCSVCRLEMPHLEKDIWKKYKDKNLLLIGIDRDEPLETVINFKKEMKTTYPVALDPGGKIFSLFAERNSGVTRNIVINQSGEIVFLTRLFEENEYKQMLKVIESLVN
jgi:peroxiredoxin